MPVAVMTACTRNFLTQHSFAELKHAPKMSQTGKGMWENLIFPDTEGHVSQMTMAAAGTSAEQQAAQEMLAAILAACNNQQQDNGWRSNPQELPSQQMHYGDAAPNMFSHGLTEEQLLQDRQAALTQQLHMVETMLAQSRAQPMAQQPKQVQIEQPRYAVPPGEITYPRNANSGKTGLAVGHAMPLPPGLTLQLAAAGIDVQKSSSDDSGGQAQNASKGQTEQPNLETTPVKAGVGTSDKKSAEWSRAARKSEKCQGGRFGQ